MTESISSARALRESLKQTQANDAYLRLYHQYGEDLFDMGWSPNTALHLLQQLCSLTAAEHALIATEQTGKLLVYAQVGQTLPNGTRIPMMGILASMLKAPVHFACYENKRTALWTHGQSDYHECIVPLALGQHAKGMMAISGKRLSLGQNALDTLKTVAGLVAIAVSQHQGPAPSPQDLSLIDRLTPREREIFALLPSGLSNQALGDKLGISAGTAKIHVERVLYKLGVKDRTQAAVKAVELGYKAS